MGVAMDILFVWVRRFSGFLSHFSEWSGYRALTPRRRLNDREGGLLVIGLI